MNALSAVAAVVLGGAGLAAAAFPERASGICDRVLRAMAAVVFGLGAWSAGYAASLLAFGAGESVRVVKDVAIALCGVALIAVRRRPAPPEVSGEVGDEAPRWLIGVFVVACAVFCLVFVEHSIRAPEGGFDAWMLWNSRARFLARAGDDFRVAFSPRLLFWTHQDYPWLLPGLVAQWFIITRTESPAIPAAVGLVFGAATIAIVTCSLARLRGARAALVGGLAVASLPCFAAFGASQQADVPLAAFVALAAALVAMAVRCCWRDSLPGSARGRRTTVSSTWCALRRLCCSASAMSGQQRSSHSVAFLCSLCFAPSSSVFLRPTISRSSRRARTWSRGSWMRGVGWR